MIKTKLFFIGLFLLFLLRSEPVNANDTCLALSKTARSESDFEEIYQIIENARNFEIVERKQIIDICIKKTKENKFEKQYAKFLFFKSIYKTLESDFETAIILVDEALVIFKKEQMNKEIALSYNILGSMAARQKDYKSGIEYLKKAFEYIKRVKKDDQLYKSELNLMAVYGNIYLYANNIDTAEAILKEGLKLSEEKNDTTFFIPFLVNSAYVEIKKLIFK